MSGLQVNYETLRREIGRFADSGRQDSDWDDTQEQDIEDALDRGLRLFYWPIINRETGEAYHWSFLEEAVTISVTAGDYQYDLSDDFCRMTEGFVISGLANHPPLAEADDAQIRTLIASENRSGDPEYYGIRSLAAGVGERSTREVLFYPVPATARTLVGRMEIEPRPLSASNPYPLGGAIHSETIIEACLAAAELVFFPEAGPGIHHDKFEQLLLRSVESDRQLTTSAVGEIWPEDPLNDGFNTLAVNKFYLMRVIGEEMGYGPHPKVWKHNQRSKVDEILRTGLRDFYTPQVMPGKQDNHHWSFLEPTYKLQLEAGVWAYAMPPEFNAVRGKVEYQANTNADYPKIHVTNAARVLEILSVTTDTFVGPTIVAFRVKESGEIIGTRWEMIVAPVPSGGESIIIPYGVNPYQLAEDASLPMGGQPHAQTIIESCLAAAEVAKGDGKRDHQNKFLLKLQASISHDLQATCPQTMGVKRTPDDDFGDVVYGDYWMDNHVTQYDLS